MMKTKLYKLTSIFVCLSIILSLVAVFPVTTSAAKKNNKDIVVVSMGDSYSSGEGIDDFYDSDMPMEDRVESEDWLAHRSENSWPGQLKFDGLGELRKHRDDNWYFVAASGATTEHITNQQKKIYYKEDGKYDDYDYLPAQIDVFDKLEKENKKADYVTISIGGNDVDFSGVIKEAAMHCSYVDNYLEDKLTKTWEEFYSTTKENIRKTYEKIAKEAGPQAKIIVVGYPKLLDQTGNGALLNPKEAKLINDSVTRFNKELRNIVASCRASGMKICFVSVEEEFNGREAYSKNSLINKISLNAKPQDIDDRKNSCYSIHPNADGAIVYRDCVQEKINYIEENGEEAEWPTRTTSDERDIVLVLDVSGSMSGNPIKETRKAAENFITTILKEDASIGIVTYDDAAEMVSDFSMNESKLVTMANDISSGGSTNIEGGLLLAEEMLENSKAKKKIIVLMSDGEPNVGKEGQDLIDYADTIKNKGISIYTLGFFSDMSYGKSAAQKLMEDIASEGYHYEVDNADDLVFFFGDIADQIQGQKYIHIRIACPVDVKVKYKGQTLSSKDNYSSSRTDFGTLTFEENEDTGNNSPDSDNRIKILRLKEGANYDIQIEGNGTGHMDYTIGFMDDKGEYSDMRVFKNIKVNKRTRVNTVAKRSSKTVVNVDENGDGKYDIKYEAKANGRGQIAKDIPYLYIIIGVVALIAIAWWFIKRKKRAIVNV